MLDKNNEPVLCDFVLSALIEANSGKLTEIQKIMQLQKF